MANDAVNVLNRVQYSGLDFDTISDDLRSQIQLQFADVYNDFATSSLGMMLLDVISFGLDTLSFYLDRRASDAYLYTAQSTNAVAWLTRQLGYKMTGGICSSVDLQVAIKQVHSFMVVIPKGFQFQGPNGIVFEAARDMSYAPTEQGMALPKSIPCYQGKTQNESFTSDGSASQEFNFRKLSSDQFLAAGSPQVLVDGGAWTESDFLEYTQTNQFEVNYATTPPVLMFGDGVAGNIPRKGASIAVTYIATLGNGGMVSKATISKEVTPLVVSGTKIDLVVNNPVGSTAGDALETAEHAKAYAGRVFKSRKVAVTQPDYEALASSFADPLFGRVAVAQAISSRSAATDLALELLLDTIRAALLLPVQAVQADVGIVQTKCAAIQTDCSNQLTYLSNPSTGVVFYTQDISHKGNALVSGIQSNRHLAADLVTGIAACNTQITGITGGATADSLKDTTKSALLAYMSTFNASASTIVSSSQLQISQVGSMVDDATLVGLNMTDPSLVVQIDTARKDVLACVGSTAASGSILYSMQDALVQLALIDPTANGANALSVAGALQGIWDHEDQLLSADCKANLVTVPILARDPAGFYTTPSNALVQSLQDYLGARKEVTQTVSVVSGAGALIQAVISIRSGIVPGGGAPSQVQVSIGSVVDGILRGRKFGVSLYLSDFDVLRVLTGIGFVNVTILGYTTPAGGSTVFTDLLDKSGNLIIPDSKVITKGQVTVLSPELMP